MRRFLPVLLLSSAAFSAGVPYLAQPALCPTRPEIAFVSGGDIWVAPSKGGEAHLLVSHAADDSRPLYSPGWRQAGVRLHAHRRRRHLHPHARLGRPEAADFRRPAGSARRVVARRQVDLFFQHGQRRRREERYLSRERGGRHADAGERRPVHQRISSRAVARWRDHRVRRAGQRRFAVVAARPQPSGRKRDLAAQGRRRPPFTKSWWT